MTTTEPAEPTGPKGTAEPTGTEDPTDRGAERVVRPSAEDARRWLVEDFGLRASAVDEVSGGTDTAAAVWRVTDDRGTVWAAKWTTRPTRTATRLVASMAAGGLDTAPPGRPTEDGRRRSRRAGGRLSVSRWSDGEDAATVGLDVDGWYRYGRLLAAVHDHGFPTPPRRQGARRGIRRRRRRYRAEIRALDVAASSSGSNPAPTDGAALLRLWREARPRVDLLLRGTEIRSAASAGAVPCHGDPHLGNLLVESDGSLRLVDWDEAVVGPREIDLHLVEFSVLFDPATDEQLAAFRDGYGPVEVDERRMVRFACIRALEDLTATMRAALGATGAERDEQVRVFTGITGPTGSASLVEDRLRALLVGGTEQRSAAR